MTYKIKKPKVKDTNLTARELHLNFMELDNQARLMYDTDFNDLSWKEQKEISKKVARGFHFKVH